MDEVDGMKSDHFGVRFLIGLIKKTRVPIICIANDCHHQKMRGLLKVCLHLRFV